MTVEMELAEERKNTETL